jgi:hypothetical protein
MRRTHSFLVLVSFLGAVALAGCGITTYTTVETKDATDGTTGFLFEDGADFRGAVSARQVDSAAGDDVNVTFTAKSSYMPDISDVRVGLSETRWGRPVNVAAGSLNLHAVSCSLGDHCTSIDSTSVAASRVRALGGEDLVLTIDYIEEVDGRPVHVTRVVRAHAAREETHHYPWVFRDC